MKFTKILMRGFGPLLAVPILAACANGEQSPDAALAGAMVGKWSWNRVSGCCARFEQAIEFKADGSFHADGVLRDAKGSKPYSFDGLWKVQERQLKLDVTSPPLDFPKGEHSERIVSVTEIQLITVNPYTGEEYRAWKFTK